MKERFSPFFTWMIVALHPSDLNEHHLDGSCDPEIPGKASNLKWGVAEGFAKCKKESFLNLNNVMLTIADADCIFHPGYFRVLAKEYEKLRVSTGNQHLWTMWQAPQLPFRNFWASPIPSRAWGYVSTMYEFGGVSSLACGGHSMVFSSYSLPLRLAVAAQAWDGDVIAEDHHAYLKCFYYSIHAAAMLAQQEGSNDAVVPKVQVKPIFLPVKSTSVVSDDGYWATWVERWHQAKRHMQGVAELSYALLAAWETLCTVPFRHQSLYLLFRLYKVIFRLWCMHMLPVLQGLALGVMSVKWYFSGMHIKECPTTLRIWGAQDFPHERARGIACGLAGAWELGWPMIIPLVLITIVNYMFIRTIFVDAKETGRKDVWHSEDGGAAPQSKFASIRQILLTLILVDVMVLVGPVMVPYGLITELIAYWSVAVRGNRFTYIAAAKALGEKSGPRYGSLGEAGGSPDKKA